MAILCTVMEEWFGRICHHQVWYRSCYQAFSSVAKHPQKGHHMGASNSHATAYKGKGTWNTLKASTRLRFESYATVPSMVHPLHSSPSVRPTSPHGPDVTSTHIYRLSILNYRILYSYNAIASLLFIFSENWAQRWNRIRLRITKPSNVVASMSKN